MKLYVVLILRIMCGICLLATNAYGETEQEGLDWLKIVIFAEHQNNYSGVFVYQYDNHVETSKITHVVDQSGEFERLERLDGPKREILRHHGQVWSHQGHDEEQVGSQQTRGKFPSLLPEQLTALSSNYRADLIGKERVAGYDAQVIVFQPRDNLRYTHKVWVHTDSGLLLKAAVLDSKGKLVEQYAFTQLQIGGKIDRSWIKRNASKTFHDTGFQEQHNQMGFPVNSGWVADSLPVGFRKTMEIQRPMHGNHAPVVQIVFSDGLSAISIFIELDDGDEDDVEGLSTRGAMSLYHKVVGKYLYTVVGEVPAHTVMRVLDSIRNNIK